MSRLEIFWRGGPQHRWSHPRARVNSARRPGRPGTTLPELLVSIFVIGLIVVVVGNLFVGSSRFSREEQFRIDVGENAARVLSTMDETLRQAKNILVSATVSGTNYSTGTDTLVFTLPSIQPDGQLSATAIDTAAIVLDPSVAGNTRLLLKLDPDASSTRPAADRPLVEHIKDVYFRYTTPTPSNATAVSVIVMTGQIINNLEYTRANILSIVLRNHP